MDSDANLSHLGDCWIHDDASAREQSNVWGNAQLHDFVRMTRQAQIYGNAHIQDSVQLTGEAQVSGNVFLQGEVRVSGTGRVQDEASIDGTQAVIQIRDAVVIGGKTSIKPDGYDTTFVIEGLTQLYDATITKQTDWVTIQLPSTAPKESLTITKTTIATNFYTGPTLKYIVAGDLAKNEHIPPIYLEQICYWVPKITELANPTTTEEANN